jgi:hypothetical protein
MPRLADKDLTSKTFRTHIAAVDAYAEAVGLDVWAARVAWIGLVYNTLGAKRFAERRSNYQTSRAWACYTRLVETGVFVEHEPREGITWDPGCEPWESDPLRWFNDVAKIAAGGAVPKEFPVNRGREVARRGGKTTTLRLVS